MINLLFFLNCFKFTIIDNKITTLIFDLGGVIINIDPSLTIKEFNLLAKRNGDITEMDFCNAVSKHGWEVFKNISCVGPVDCIVMNTKGKLYKVDVKTVPNLNTLWI